MALKCLSPYNQTKAITHKRCFCLAVFNLEFERCLAKVWYTVIIRNIEVDDEMVDGLFPNAVWVQHRW